MGFFEPGIDRDELDRLKTVSNTSGGPVTGTLASYEYIGNRLLKRSYGPNGLLLTMANDAGTSATGYDGDKRLVELRHKSGSSVQTGFGYAHDRMDNRLSEARQHNAQTSEVWTYDSLYRLVDQKRDVPFGGGTPPEQRTWTLDGAQNWASLSISVNGGTPSVLTQAMNDLNSYTSFGGVAQSDDPEGNRLDDGGFLYKWDFLNRLREVRRKSDNALISESSYDAAGANGHLNGSGRRVRKAVSNSGALNEDLRFLWEGLSVIQEQDGSSGTLIRQYVHAGLGAHLELDRDTNADGILDQALFFHENVMGWTHALTDVSGAVAERYSYDAYGSVTYLAPSGTPASDQSKSALGNRLLYGGLYLDEESATYYALHRTYSPSQGRWLSRDPIGIWKDPRNLGNGYCYVGGSPSNAEDPEGLWKPKHSGAIVRNDSTRTVPISTNDATAGARRRLDLPPGGLSSEVTWDVDAVYATQETSIIYEGRHYKHGAIKVSNGSKVHLVDDPVESGEVDLIVDIAWAAPRWVDPEVEFGNNPVMESLPPGDLRLDPGFVRFSREISTRKCPRACP